MNAFEIVIIVVAVIAVLSALTPWFRVGGLRRLGRVGGNWFDHADETPIELRPSEDDRDAPLPRRPIRGRPDFSRKAPGA